MSNPHDLSKSPVYQLGLLERENDEAIRRKVKRPLEWLSVLVDSKNKRGCSTGKQDFERSMIVRQKIPRVHEVVFGSAAVSGSRERHRLAAQSISERLSGLVC